MSTTGLVAQNPKDNTILQRSLMLAMVLASLIIFFQTSLYQCAIYVINPKHSIQNLLSLYFHYRIYATVPTLLNYVILGYFFGRQNTRSPLVLLLVINTSAILLDLLFVTYGGLGLKGLAIANVVAQSLGMMLGLFLIEKNYSPFRLNFSPIFNVSDIKKLFHLNKDIFIRTLCLLSTFAYFTYSGSTLGVNTVAANGILLSMHHFVSYALDGFAIACEALIGQALSRHNKKDFILISKQCGHFSFLVASIFSLIFYCFGSALLKVITNTASVLTQAQLYLPWLVVLPLLSAGSYVLDGIFIGATWSQSMRNTMLFTTIGVFFPLTHLLSHWQNNGLWLAFSLFMCGRGLSLLWALKKKLDHGLVK